MVSDGVRAFVELEAGERQLASWLDGFMATTLRRRARSQPLLVEATPGAGKTTAIAEAVLTHFREGHVFHVMLPTLEKAQELANDMNARAEARGQSVPLRVIRGRSAVDPNTPQAADGEPHAPKMCRRAEVAGKYARCFGAVQDGLCHPLRRAPCPFAEHCPYQLQLDEIRRQPSAVYISANNYFFSRGTVPKPDIVIVDEDITLRSQSDTAIDIAELDVLLHRLAVDDARVVRAIVDALAQNPAAALEQLRFGTSTAAPLSREGLRTTIRNLVALREARREIVNSISDAALPAFLDETLEDPAARIAERLLRQIDFEFERARPSLTSAIVRTEGQDDRATPELLLSWLKQPAWPDVPKLFLDATPDRRLLEQVLGQSIRHHRLCMREQGYYVRVTGKSFSKSSLIGDINGTHHHDNAAACARLRRKLYRLVQHIPGRILVVAPKELETIWRDEHNDPRIVLRHYNALRGINNLSSLETVILIGRSEPAAEDVNLIARAFAAGDDAEFTSGEYGEHPREFELIDGSTVPLPIRTLPHFWSEAVLGQIRDAEVEQCRHRTRPLRHRRLCIVLSNAAPWAPVDEVVPWSDFELGFTAVGAALQETGLVPLCPQHLAVVFPYHFKTTRAAESFLYRRRQHCEKTRRSYLESLIGSRVFSRDIRMHQYRIIRRRQRSPKFSTLVTSIYDQKTIHLKLENLLTQSGILDFDDTLEVR